MPRLWAHTLYATRRDYRPAPAGEPFGGPVFLVGSPRSGTTFLGSALGRVPGGAYLFEPVLMKAVVPYVWSGSWSDERARGVVLGLHERLLRSVGAPSATLVEKTPRSVFIADRLADWYPSARIVVLLRDGRDVALSWSRKPWLADRASLSARQRRRIEPGGYRYGPRPHFWVEPSRIEEFVSTTPTHRAAWGWRRHVEAWEEVEASIPEERRLEVRYEALVSDRARTAERLSAFLGLTPGAASVLAGEIASASPTSVGGWAASEVADDVAALAEMQPALGRLGYL